MRLHPPRRGPVALLACALACVVAGSALAHDPAGGSALSAPDSTGRPVELTGSVAVLHADGGEQPDQLVLVTDDGPVALHADPGLVESLPLGSRTPHSVQASGELRVAVVLLSFADDPQQPFDAASVDATMFSGPASVAQLYAEQSGGRLTVSGTVFGWLATSHTTTSCDFAAWADTARFSLGPALDGYTHLVVIVPRTTACAWAGLAYVGGTTSWLNGSPTAFALSHELGHNLALGHARTWRCAVGELPAALTDTCAVDSEYGDPFSPMGSATTVHAHGVHKAQLGWLAPEEVTTVTASGSYELVPLGSAVAGAKVLRIPRGDEWLYVELRQPAGAFESLLTPAAAGGVAVRLAREAAGEDWDARLLDATPETPTFSDAVLTPGRSLTDTVTGVRLTSVAVGPGSATVAVELGTAGDTTPPSQPALTDVSTDLSGRVALAWSASTDDVAVARYEVLRDGRVVATTVSTGVVDVLAEAASARYAVRAVDTTGNIGPASAEMRVRLPERTLRAPRRLAAVARVTGQRATVILRWRELVRSDVRYLVWRGERLLGRTRSARWVDSLPLSAGSAVYRVVAFSDDGSRATSAPLTLSLGRLLARAERTRAPLRVAARR